MSNLPPPPPESTPQQPSPESNPPQFAAPQSQSPHLPPPPTFDPGTSAVRGESFNVPAPRGRRLLAGFLDNVLSTVLTAAFGGALLGFNSQDPGVVSAFQLSVLLPSLPWFLLLAVFFRWSTSPAKRLFRFTVVNSSTGQPASFGQMALRELVGKYLLSMLTGGLTILIGAIMLRVSGRTLWDVIARTDVVERG